MTDTPKTEWTDWISHKPGDPCPIPQAGAQEYQIRLRDGWVSVSPVYNATARSWGKNSGSNARFDIIAYRTLKEPSP